MEDRYRVSIDFKLSKNYNSIGASASFESSAKPDESPDDLFKRVLSQVDKDVDGLMEKCKEVINNTK